MAMTTVAPSAPVGDPGTPPPTGGVDRFFKISQRGSTVAREVRGGFATFFTMAYIVVLNPIILSSGKDMNGHVLSMPQLITATALIAAIMTLIMGVGGNVPLAIAAGLGLDGVVAFQIAPQMTWPDAMGLVVLEGLGIVVLVATGARQAIMDAIPLPLKQAIGVGIGLFIAFIGLVDAGFVGAAQGTPVQLGRTGQLAGWPVVVFVVGLALTTVLLVKRVKGALLISIITATVLAIVLNSVFDLPSKAWSLNVPAVPSGVVGKPDFGLFGHFSIGGGFAHAGVVTALVFAFTLILSDFFDAMGTIIGVSDQAGLLDERGRLPGIGRILFIDGLAAVAGGAGGASSNTCFIESASGVGEGARTGLANVVTGALFVVALFLTPLATVVPSEAATPALVAVGFLMMTQVKDIPWDDYTVAIPAFLTIVLMPFTYSITNGIGAGFIAFVVLRTATGRVREIKPLLWLVALFFLAYFCLNPIEAALGVH
jgi:AGZA family xanthine/uracil permease-like MFS transporter